MRKMLKLLNLKAISGTFLDFIYLIIIFDLKIKILSLKFNF